jgi:pre-mRNA-processing factor 6
MFCLSKGLSECPKSGQLWALAVELEPRANRKKKVSDAMEACPDNSLVNLCVAKIFWK